MSVDDPPSGGGLDGGWRLCCEGDRSDSELWSASGWACAPERVVWEVEAVRAVECVPDTGEAPHMIRPAMSLKRVGKMAERCCPECDRGWADTEGMPAAERARFTLREVAGALVEVARGVSYREAAEHARLRAGHYHRCHGVRRASSDGHSVRRWVDQYAPIVAAGSLPQEWPRVLVVDHLPVHVRDFDSPTPSGQGRLSRARRVVLRDRQAADAWRVWASRSVDQVAWEAFLGQLPGQPITSSATVRVGW